MSVNRAPTTHPASRLWNHVVRGLEVVTISLFVLLTLDVLWGVISRYTPGIRPSDWTEELAVYLLVWVSLLGAALTFRDHGHLGVDYFMGKLDPAARRVAAIVAELCVLLFALIALVWGGFRLVADTLAVDQITPVLQWRIGYIYSVVPISGVFTVVFCLEHLARLLRGEAGTEETEEVIRDA